MKFCKMKSASSPISAALSSVCQATMAVPGTPLVIAATSRSREIVLPKAGSVKSRGGGTRPC